MNSSLTFLFLLFCCFIYSSYSCTLSGCRADFGTCESNVGNCTLNSNCTTSLSVCSNRGICSSLSNDTSAGNGTCVCSSGNYFGDFCELTYCFGHLSTSPSACSSHGVCSDTNSCTCNNGWSGLTCSIPLCYGINSTLPSVCSGHGACVAPNSCNCTQGYSGLTCSLPQCYGINSTSPSVCSGHGTCITPDTCSCSLGYAGPTCSFPICHNITSTSPSVCSGHGACVAPNSCNCTQGYSGLTCSLPQCYGINSTSPSVCSGHGACVAPDTCSCSVGYTGPTCSSPICYGINSTSPSVCSGHGACVAPNICSCSQGYTGPTCSNTLIQCFGINSNHPGVCFGKGVCLGTNLCSCYGYNGGQDCSQNPYFLCPLYNVTQTQTGYPSSISSLNFINNNLTFNIQMPFVLQRKNSTIYIQNKSYSQCIFPSQGNSYEFVTPCTKYMSYAIPFSNASQCGWEITNSSTQVFYNGRVYHEYLEEVGLFEGIPLRRTIVSSFPIQITFTKSINIFATLNVSSNIEFSSAIILQQFQAGPPVSGLIQILTSLDYPYMISSNSSDIVMLSYPSGMNISIDIASNNCQQNIKCYQVFSVNILPGPHCTFTGIYSVKFKIKCNPLYQGSCTTEEPTTVNLNIASENFCTKTNVNINLIANMFSYSNPSHTVTQNQFNVFNRAYFKGFVSSTATITALKIKWAQWYTGFSSGLLYSGAVSPHGVLQNFTIDHETASTVAFSFIIPDSVFNSTSSQIVSVYANIEVTYLNVQGDFAKREFLIGSEETGDKVEKNLETKISAKKGEVVSSSSKVFISGVMLLLILII